MTGGAGGVWGTAGAGVEGAVGAGAGAGFGTAAPGEGDGAGEGEGSGDTEAASTGAGAGSEGSGGNDSTSGALGRVGRLDGARFRLHPFPLAEAYHDRPRVLGYLVDPEYAEQDEQDRREYVEERRGEPGQRQALAVLFAKPFRPRHGDEPPEVPAASRRATRPTESMPFARRASSAATMSA